MTPNFTTIFRDNGYELAMGGEIMWAQERHSRDLVTVPLQISLIQTFLKMVQEGLPTGHTSLLCAELLKLMGAGYEITGTLIILDCANGTSC